MHDALKSLLMGLTALLAANAAAHEPVCIAHNGPCYVAAPGEPVSLSLAPNGCAVTGSTMGEHLQHFLPDWKMRTKQGQFLFNMLDRHCDSLWENLDDHPLYTITDKTPDAAKWGLTAYSKKNPHVGKETVFVMPKPHQGRIACSEKAASCDMTLREGTMEYSIPILKGNMPDWAKQVDAFKHFAASIRVKPE